MTDHRLTEAVVEEAALARREATGWRITYGPDPAPDMPGVGRRYDGEAVPTRRLRDALARRSPALSAEASA
ncbi:MAG TPA: hypothetical protein PLP31_13350 [Thermoanaerobaculaceae bacterium]|nr:hypothetical protein [Thermoanaerobaculaceae bacterium]